MDGERGVNDLLAAAKAGDKMAENELFSRLRARILAVVQCSVWGREDAQDLAQEIMQVVHGKYKEVDLPGGLLPWVFGITRNKILNYYRQRRRRSEPLGLDEPDRDPSPDQVVAGKELEGLILRALPGLNEKHRNILVALLKGEIKAYISSRSRTTPLGTIYSDISRCRKRLLELLQEEGWEP